MTDRLSSWILKNAEGWNYNKFVWDEQVDRPAMVEWTKDGIHFEMLYESHTLVGRIRDPRLIQAVTGRLLPIRVTDYRRRVWKVLSNHAVAQSLSCIDLATAKVMEEAAELIIRELEKL